MAEAEWIIKRNILNNNYCVLSWGVGMIQRPSIIRGGSGAEKIKKNDIRKFAHAACLLLLKQQNNYPSFFSGMGRLKRMESKANVFISHAKEDLETAKKLYVDLRQAGVNPWLSEEDHDCFEN